MTDTLTTRPQMGDEELNAKQFVYLECRECGFDAVVRESENKRTLCCPLCAGDNGRDVDMSEKVGVIPDRVEGRDARKEATP